MMRGREDWNQKLVAVAIDKDKGSQHALKWALQRLVTKGQIILLIHVNTNAVPIPSSIGNQTSEVKEEANQQQQSAQIRELFLPFRCFCTRKDIQCRDAVIEDTDISKAIVNYVSNYAIEDLVLGASSRNPLVKRFKGSSDVPTMVSKAAPDFCSVYVVSKEKVSSHRPANRPAPPIANHRKQILMRQTAVKPAIKVHEPQSPTILDYQQGRPSVQSDDSESIKSPFSRNSRGSNVRGYGEWNLTDSDISFVSSGRPSSERSYLPLYDQLETSRLSRGSNGGYCSGDNVSFDSIHSGQRSIDLNSLGPLDTSSAYSTNSGRLSSTSLPMEDVDAEMRRLRLELKHTMDMYSNACKEAINAKQKARELHRWRLEEEQKLEEARMAEELARNLAEKEKAKCRAAMEKAEAAQRLAEIEAQRRRSAEMKAGREADEKANALSALTRGDVRYRRYSIDEIERATDYFAEARKIGEGSYGPVYRCYLDHTPVAVKVLRPDAAQGRTQFQQEVEILSCIRHPNMVLLLGACPEYGCLVYEYLANGSLEDRLFRRGNTPPLSWQTRFRIAAEIATGLLFLHQTKPEPLVHRDLKPANILLDRNYVSKISDVGLARLVPPSVASNVTQYRMTSTAGTFCYIDPEYQQTGMLTIKSDIYSLGIMLLQLVTGRVAMGLTHHVENAIENGKFEEMLDPLVTDWPVEEALCFAKMALRCAELRRKERPDLASEVLPELDRLRGQEEESFGCFSNADNAVASPAFSLVSNPQETVSDNSGYESRSSMSSAAGRGSSVE